MRVLMLGLLLVARAAAAATFLSEIQALDAGSQFGRVITSDGQFLYTTENIYGRVGGGFLVPITPYDAGVPSPNDVSLGSADAAFLYVSGIDGIAVYARDAMSGLPTFVEVAPGPPAFPYRDPVFMAVTPDGTNLYATTSSSIVTYVRDPTTGELTFLEEIEGGIGFGDINGLQGPNAIIVSPDGLHVYVAAQSVVAFSRGLDGALTLVAVYDDLSSFDSIIATADGAQLYAGRGAGGIARYVRNPLDGTLSFVGHEPGVIRPGLERFADDNERLALSADGTRLVGQSQNYVVVYDRDVSTGALDIVTVERAGGRHDLAMSPDALNLYAGSKPLSVFAFATFDCPAAPTAGCQPPAATAKSALSIKNSDPLNDRISWRSTPAGITSLADFGDPTAAADDVLFCLYDASVAPQPVAEIVGPARGTCDGDPCWEHSSPTALKYKDDTGLPQGLQKVTVRQRTPDHGTVKLKAKSRGLTLPAMPLVPPVRAQLRSRTGACWDSTFSLPKHNDVRSFSAKSD